MAFFELSCLCIPGWFDVLQCVGFAWALSAHGSLLRHIRQSPKRRFDDPFSGLHDPSRTASMCAVASLTIVTRFRTLETYPRPFGVEFLGRARGGVGALGLAWDKIVGLCLNRTRKAS